MDIEAIRETIKAAILRSEVTVTHSFLADYDGERWYLNGKHA